MEDMNQVRMELARMCSEHVEGLRIAVHIVVIAGCLLAVSSAGASVSTLVWIGVICAAEVFGLWLEELDD